MILFDNFNDYYSPIIKQRNVEYLEKKYPLQILDATLIIIRGSINDEELLKMIFQKYKITHIAHLAVSFSCLNYLVSFSFYQFAFKSFRHSLVFVHHHLKPEIIWKRIILAHKFYLI